METIKVFSRAYNFCTGSQILAPEYAWIFHQDPCVIPRQKAGYENAEQCYKKWEKDPSLNQDCTES